MKIASYKLKYGLFYPKSVHNYVHERVAALGRRTQRQLGDDYAIWTNKSTHSEASYVRIRNRKTGVVFIVSFRNHGTFGPACDRIIRLDKFKTWKECRGVFLEKILPNIITKMNTDLVLQAEFERELHRTMDNLLESVR
jgi:hypothetical protein